MRRFMPVILIAAVLIAIPILSACAQASDDGARQTRVDVGGFYYDFTEGGDQYGPWWGARVKALSSPPPGKLGFTGIVELVAERHQDTGDETGGFYINGGGYYDLSEDLFTFTSVGVGTDEPFVQFNVHEELSFKLPPSRSVVIGAGGGYVDYQTQNDASYFALGSTYYWSGTFSDDPSVVIQYQYRRYFANPVDRQLNTHILSFGFGRRPQRWSQIRYVRGQEFFRAGGSTTAVFDADQDGQVLTVEHEELLNAGFGVVVSLDIAQKRNNLDDRTLFSGPGVEMRFFWRF